MQKYNLLYPPQRVIQQNLALFLELDQLGSTQRR